MAAGGPLLEALEKPQLSVDVGPEFERRFSRVIHREGPHILSTAGFIKDFLADAVRHCPPTKSPIRALERSLDAAIKAGEERAGAGNQTVAHLAMYQVCLCITRAFGGTARAPSRVVVKLDEIEVLYGLDIDSIRTANGVGELPLLNITWTNDVRMIA